MNNNDVCTKSLQNKLVSALKIDNLWIEFMDVIGDEISSMREKIKLSKDLYNIDKQLEDGLINIIQSFGYTPNLIVNNSLQMVKKEVESIPTRIRNKTTYDGYYIILKQIGRLGDIYNYYWSGNKLIKAIKWDEIVKTLTDMRSYTEPFLKITPDKNFSIISSSAAINLDSGYILDDKIGQFNWMLDRNIEISPTKHLGIEFCARTLDDFGENGSLLESKYLNYLSTGVEYNRRIPIVPHVGLQLTGYMMEGEGYNFFDDTVDYTIPSLKLSCCTGYEYNKKLTDFGGFDLDNDNNKGLDELITWSLDKEKNTDERISLIDFKYISCGNGSLHLQTTQKSNLFPYDTLILMYTYSDNDDSYNIKDYSMNSHSSQLVGYNDIRPTTKKIEGIIGKTVNFDGITSLKSNSMISIVETDLTIGFWFNANDEFSDNIQCLMEIGKLKIKYDYLNEKLIYEFDTIEDSISVSKLENHNVIFELDSTNKELRLFVDSILLNTRDITDISYADEDYFYIGSNSENEEKFIGLIDSTWILNKFYSQSDKEYLFNNKQGVITQLAHKLSCYELDNVNECYSNDDWYLIQSHIKADDVTNEFAFFCEKSTDIETEIVNIFYDEDLGLIKDDMNSPKEPKSSINYDFLDKEYTFIVYQNGNEYIYKDNLDNYWVDTKQTERFEGDISTYIPNGYKWYEDITHTFLKLKYDTYIGNTEVYAIRSEKFSLTYKKLDSSGTDYVSITLKSDKNGNLYNVDNNRIVSGHINYETGEYNLYTVTERYVTQEQIINTLSSNRDINCNLNCDSSQEICKIKEGTVKIYYTIGDNKYVSSDNGQGIISGFDIIKALINYNSKYVELHFNHDINMNDILVEYTYYEDLGMIENSSVTFDYKVNNVPVTEIGLENEDHELLAYMTFPTVNFDTINNHISAMFAIRKQKNT